MTGNRKLKQTIDDKRHFGKGFLFWKVMNKVGFASNKRVESYIENYYLSLTLEEREQELQKWFLEMVGYPLNLKNPKTLDEKIQWLKLYDSTPQKTQLADKYQVREWIAEQIGEQYLVPLLGVWDSSAEINFDSLPNQYVLKANHGSTMNFIVKDNTTLERNQTRKKVDKWLNTNYGIGPDQEWHYLHTPHKVLAEQYIGSFDKTPIDYKVYCFDGVPKFIQVIEGRFKETKQIFLNVDWEVVPFWNTRYERMDTLPQKPKQLSRIIDFSKKLAKGFSLVRIDWYLIGEDKIYFGEMTFTPASGKQKWIPNGTDEMLGNLVTLPQKKFIVR